MTDTSPLEHLIFRGPKWVDLSSALVDALAELTVVETTRSAKIPTRGGGEFSYDYADIADVVEKTRPVLATHGLVALTPVHEHGDGLAVTVILLHRSGERLDLGPFPFPAGIDARATGSMVTYHRRYALLAALGMATTGSDDDGAAAGRPPVEEPAPVARPRKRAAPFSPEKFVAACSNLGIDPADVLAHANITRPVEDLRSADRPRLYASLAALRETAGHGAVEGGDGVPTPPAGAVTPPADREEP